MSESTFEQSESIAELAKALAKAQTQMGAVAKNSENPFLNSKYADLAGHLSAALPVLSEHGLSLVQTPCGTGELARMRTMLLHESGEFIASTDSMRPKANDPQGIGSCDTYLRRYGLSIYGAYADDDDGKAATREQAAAPTEAITTEHKLFNKLVERYAESGEEALNNARMKYIVSEEVEAIVKSRAEDLTDAA